MTSLLATLDTPGTPSQFEIFLVLAGSVLLWHLASRRSLKTLVVIVALVLLIVDPTAAIILLAAAISVVLIRDYLEERRKEKRWEAKLNADAARKRAQDWHEED